MDILKRTRLELFRGPELVINPKVRKVMDRIDTEREEVRTQLRGFTSMEPLWEEINFSILRPLNLSDIPDPETYQEIMEWITNSREHVDSSPKSINAHIMAAPPVMFFGGAIKLFWVCPYCEKPRHPPKHNLVSYQDLQVRQTSWVSCYCIYQKAAGNPKEMTTNYHAHLWNEARTNKLNPDLPETPPLIPNQIVTAEQVAKSLRAGAINANYCEPFKLKNGESND